MMRKASLEYSWQARLASNHHPFSYTNDPIMEKRQELEGETSNTSKAHIPLKNRFALGHNVNEIDTNNMKCTCPTRGPNTRKPNATYIPPVPVGGVVGCNANVIVCVGVTQILVFLDNPQCKTLALGVLPNATAQCEWKIGLALVSVV